MIEAVSFDLDGTLYDEKDFVKSGFWAVSAYLASKYSIITDVLYNHLITEFDVGLRGKNFDVLINKFDLIEEKVTDLVKIYRSHRPDIKLYSDAETLLVFLKEKQYKLGLITDGNTIAQRNKIQALYLPNFFNEIIVTDELGKKYWKPSDIAFKKMLHMLKVIPEKCVYVGDNPVKDFFPAKKLGMITVRVRRGNGFHDSTEVSKELDADHQVNDLSSFSTLLLQL